MSGFKLTSDTLDVVPGAGSIEYNGQFFGTDSNSSRAQMGRLVHETAKASTSGTVVDFTGIPAWVKRITVMLNGVSSTGTSNFLIQLGASGVVETSGYTGAVNREINFLGFSSGIILNFNRAAAASHVIPVIFTLFGSNNWVCSFIGARSDSLVDYGAGSKTLSATLDRIRITTVNGTDTFDAGSINILYEG